MGREVHDQNHSRQVGMEVSPGQGHQHFQVELKPLRNHPLLCLDLFNKYHGVEVSFSVWCWGQNGALTLQRAMCPHPNLPGL